MRSRHNCTVVLLKFDRNDRKNLTVMLVLP